MHDICSQTLNIQELLTERIYFVDKFQREFEWDEDQIHDLIEDLTRSFKEYNKLGDYNTRSEKYGYYFLGSIVLSKTKNGCFQLVDGHQRLTSVLLLLIYLNNQQRESPKKNRVEIEHLILDNQSKDRKFRLYIEERDCLFQQLFEGDPNGEYEDYGFTSNQVIIDRYLDIIDFFPSLLKANELPLFARWLISKVKINEIVVESDQDAYKIFERINERGKDLSSPDKLTRYILTRIKDPKERLEAKEIIEDFRKEFYRRNDEVEADFFTAWFWAQFSLSQSETKAQSQYYDPKSTELHWWFLDNESRIGLNSSEKFYDLITGEFRFYAEIYTKLLRATYDPEGWNEGLHGISFNYVEYFKLEFPLFLAAANPDDNEKKLQKKLIAVSDFIDCFTNLWYWNSKSIKDSDMKNVILSIIHDIRNKPPEQVQKKLYSRYKTELKELDFSKPICLDISNKWYVQRLLARMTYWLEEKLVSQELYKFEEYMNTTGQKSFEIEHIWAIHFERFADEFNDDRSEFEMYRNMIGGLILLPKSVNASLGDLPFEDKNPRYLGQNLLARTLHPQFYKNNPKLRRLMRKYKLPFKPYDKFNKSDLEERSNLLCKLASIIWSPNRLKP